VISLGVALLISPKAGPAGLFLTLLLARYGLNDDSLLCLDSKPGTLKSGQADGLQPRTLEVLKSLGISDEIITEGCQMWEVAFWNPVDASAPAPTKQGQAPKRGIERTSYVPDVAVPARFPHEVTVHQGRIERILEEDLLRYSERGIERSQRFIKFEIDEEGDPEFPVKIEVERIEIGDSDTRPERRTIRAKHLVGADGAHSEVRKGMGLRLEGETSDHIWGVVDFIATTDFPDVRRRCAIHSDSGSVMIIPRERISTGAYLTRLYVQVKDEEQEEEVTSAPNLKSSPGKAKEKRAAITLDYIMDQARRVFYPYNIEVKKGTEVDWWAAYQIGQRMTPSFSMKGPDGSERVFIVGDGKLYSVESVYQFLTSGTACHTHSPKAGQGMNVSMMDSYNLSWKLVHHLHGLTPQSKEDNKDAVLQSFGSERLTIAKQLIDFDTKFSSMFSGQIGAKGSDLEGLTHEQFLEVFSSGNGFTSGCGVEYPEGTLVDNNISQQKGTPTNQDYINGILKPGRRLLDVTVKRYADSNPRHLQDGLCPSTSFPMNVANVSRLPIIRTIPDPRSLLYRSDRSQG
jgi:phenol 2-monooxygenase (NADPH)